MHSARDREAPRRVRSCRCSAARQVSRARRRKLLSWMTGWIGILLLILPSWNAATCEAAGGAAALARRGVGFVARPSDTLRANCSDMASLRTSWYYNWKPTEPCPPTLTSSYVPMICAS